MYKRIGEVKKIIGISTRTIRYYEEIGLITKIKRDSSNYRAISEDDIYILTMITHFRSAGWSVDEIRKLLESNNQDEIKRQYLIALKEERAKVNRLIKMIDNYFDK
ncbi:MerR family transcriptional regulator [Listeria monocytogenes]|uniref:MerR family transcriptional regulator n=1 Tax=Listeria monocytogenes TaxID=1639 RepID=A0AAN3BFB7_LISMN|nr:MerR family transcriptional regulator [Listeria monocytogenes]EAC3367783.1 MerR family transcriptional regulator [Listeria monocytogenes]EAC7086959.1 MerR family transcriptional regulator [Listeria monocytogenes]EAC8542038.1 MerR family transcriptional regulator [Listeria monocytogenes]EAC8548040.1 MerR family transcriptional regulator [Listeria monocytogenes]